MRHSEISERLPRRRIRESNCTIERVNNGKESDEMVSQEEFKSDDINVMRFEMTSICIGRSRECDLSLSSDVLISRVVSKKHARIYPCMFENNQEVRWFLKDLNSKHGTSLNGQDLKPNHSIQVFDGDTIVLARQHGVYYQIKCHIQGPRNSIMVLHTSSPLNTHSKSALLAEKRKNDTGDTTVRKRFRSLENDQSNQSHSPLKCPICFEFFMESLTLSCSHTFCGSCLQNWLPHSLTCPTCRVPVTNLPVRTRALDELCMQLVDPKDSSWFARREAYTLENLRLAKKARKIRHAFQEAKTLPWPTVWTLWTNSNERTVFLQTISTTIGAVREAWCEAVGLTEEAIDTQTKSKLAIASTNLLDAQHWSNYCDLRHRLRMFLRYG